MKNYKFLLILFILFIFLNLPIFVFSQAQRQNAMSTPQTQENISLRIFYNALRPAADIKCLSGNTALAKITNCITTISKALRYFAVILFVIGLTYTAGLMIISPFKTDSIKQAKTILLWIVFGFIILFIAEKIMELIKQLAG